MRLWLTALSGISLFLSFIPGLSFLSYASVLCGSYEAIQSAYSSLRDRRLDVNLLMLIAAVGAIAVGRVSDAAALLFLFSLSTTLESLAMARTKSAIESLVRLRPSKAWRVREGRDEQVLVESLTVGDIIRIPAYETVPADSIIVEGRSRIDESSMTGEAEPVPRDVEDPIVGGTQNLEGTLLAKVTAVVGDSALDKIVALVQEAQDNKASGERISEWFGQRYTIFVLIAFSTSLAIRAAIGQPFSEGFYTSLTLLVGMSPCALVISTPATTLSALAWCARNGILVRGGEFIELAGLIKVVALDKTGTLTWGKPVLREVVYFPFDGPPVAWKAEEDLNPQTAYALQMAAAAEQHSSHPIARAILDALREQRLEIPAVTNHQVVSGLGVEAATEKGIVRVGRERMLQEAGVAIPAGVDEHLQRLQVEGQSVSLVGMPLGVAVLGLSDGVRSGAMAFIRRLRALGIQRVAILTGDRAEAAKVVADQVGIAHVYAGLMPGEKTDRLKELQELGPVMMVGDGVNDAPSLATASVGVAMGGLGSDIAMNSADVVLIHDRIERIPDLISLGRRTVSTIRANLLFAGAVVVTLTFASLFTRLPLPIAVVGHEGSTVIVILNGLRMLSGPRQPKELSA